MSGPYRDELEARVATLEAKLGELELKVQETKLSKESKDPLKNLEYTRRDFLGRKFVFGHQPLCEYCSHADERWKFGRELNTQNPEDYQEEFEQNKRYFKCELFRHIWAWRGCASFQPARKFFVRERKQR